MTRDEVCDALRQLRDTDPEGSHLAADKLIIDYLKSIGEEAVAEAYDETWELIGFWFA